MTSETISTSVQICVLGSIAILIAVYLKDSLSLIMFFGLPFSTFNVLMTSGFFIILSGLIFFLIIVFEKNIPSNSELVGFVVYGTQGLLVTGIVLFIGAIISIGFYAM